MMGKRFESLEEKKAIIHNYLKSNKDGLTLNQIKQILKVTWIKKVLHELVLDGAVKKLKFGNAYLYRPT